MGEIPQLGQQERFLNQLLTYLDSQFRNANGNQWFKEIQRQQLVITSLGGRKKAFNSLDKTIKNMLTQELTWQNSNYNISPRSINLLHYINTNSEITGKPKL